MNRNARITQSQDSSSRRINLPNSGFGCAATGCVSLPFIWHHLNFDGPGFFGTGCAGIEFGLRAVHRIYTRVARRAERAGGIADGAAQTFEREIAQGIGAEISPDLLDRALARVAFAFEGVEFLLREPGASPGFIGRDQFLARRSIHAV